MVDSRNQITYTKSLVPAWASDVLSVRDLELIEASIHEAEGHTSGEIVPMLVRSSVHEASVRRILALLFVLPVFILTPLFVESYGVTELLIEMVLIGAAFWLSTVIVMPQWLIRYLVPERDLVRQVHERAELEFYRSRIHNTSGHTGILLFVSLAEHVAVVLADKAISTKLPQKTWDEVLALLLNGFKSDNAGRGFSQAIELCGKILTPLFPRATSDQNELNNSLEFRDSL
jgi:putative membrane protein